MPEGENATMTELAKVSWEQFVQAMRVFENDLELVRHPHTPKISPFGPTNGTDDEGHRQYNLTQIPEGMTEEQFAKLLKTRKIVKVGCMDKDASGPSYDQLSQEVKDEIFQILVAGGGVQLQPERIDALRVILDYIALNGNRVQEVRYTGHDHGCGYVASRNGKNTVCASLGVEPRSPEEIAVMQQLILDTAQKVGVQEMFSNAKITFGVEDINRKGNVTLVPFASMPINMSQQALSLAHTLITGHA